MHHGTCVTHVPWCMSGSLTRCSGENVPGIPGACAPAIYVYGKRPMGRGTYHSSKCYVDALDDLRRPWFIDKHHEWARELATHFWITVEIAMNPPVFKCPTDNKSLRHRADSLCYLGRSYFLKYVYRYNGYISIYAFASSVVETALPRVAD